MGKKRLRKGEKIVFVGGYPVVVNPQRKSLGSRVKEGIGERVSGWREKRRQSKEFSDYLKSEREEAYQRSMRKSAVKSARKAGRRAGRQAGRKLGSGAGQGGLGGGKLGGVVGWLGRRAEAAERNKGKLDKIGKLWSVEGSGFSGFDDAFGEKKRRKT